MKITYRPEIDGLRAVAVLPVILFHAGFGVFGGGFVGVDVFFVISGYLITSIILKDAEAGTFSFWQFYERRARRILPALFLVLICCIPFAWMWMLPLELKAFSASVFAVIVFMSNVFFWRHSGYFDQAAEFIPLLHTWSLAVEEHFYIIFPITIILLWRLGRGKVVWSIALLAMFSFALSEYGSRFHPSANFYLLPTRAWELMAGALCAMTTIRPNDARDNLLSFAGLSGIAVSVFSFDETTPFPSAYALLPVLGTCAIILFARRGTYVFSFLSTKVLVGIGLVSYSAYLWHQPLFAFARLRSMQEPAPILMITLAAVALALAYFTWRYVETPFRKKSNGLFSRPGTALVSLGVAVALLAVFNIGSHASGGFPSRFDGVFRAIEQRLAGNHGLGVDCELFAWRPAACQTDDEPEVVVWGDSYAMHLVDGLIASNPNIYLIQMTSSGCGPFWGIAPTTWNSVTWARKCLYYNDKVMSFIERSKSVKYVVLGSIFSQFVGDDSRVLLRDGSIREGDAVALKALLSTLDKLKSWGVKAVVFAPPPSPGFDAGHCLSRALIFHEAFEKCSFSLNRSLERQAEVRSLLKSVEERHEVVWLDDAVCSDGFCSANEGESFIYRDQGHFSHEGSALVGKKLSFYGLLTARHANVQDLGVRAAPRPSRCCPTPSPSVARSVPHQIRR